MHLVEGLTVPQSLRLAMLYLARRPDRQDALHKNLSSAQPCNEDVKTICNDLNDQISGFRQVEGGSLHDEDAGESIHSDVRPFIDMVLGVKDISTTRRGGPASRIHEMYKNQQELHRDSGEERNVNVSPLASQIDHLQKQAQQDSEHLIQQLQMQAKQHFMQQIEQLQTQAQQDLKQKIEQLQMQAQQFSRQQIEQLQSQAQQDFQKEIEQLQKHAQQYFQKEIAQLQMHTQQRFETEQYLQMQSGFQMQAQQHSFHQHFKIQAQQHIQIQEHFQIQLQQYFQMHAQQDFHMQANAAVAILDAQQHLQMQQQAQQQHSVAPTNTSTYLSFVDSSARNELPTPPLSSSPVEELGVNVGAIERLVSMGFMRSIVEQLLRKHSNNDEVVLNEMLSLQTQEQEREDYWREFCRRKESMIRTTCIIDFPYADIGPHDSLMPTTYEEDNGEERFKLNLSGDNRLLERLYCFEDLGDMCEDHVVKGKRRRVILKVHTLRKWGERGNELFLRADKVTSVKVTYAYFDPQQNQFFMETGRHNSLQLLPVSRRPRERWQDLYRNDRSSEIEWQWRTTGSIPSFEDKAASQRYNEVRAAIRMGEDSVFPRGATPESMVKNDPCWWYRQWFECNNISLTNQTLRDDTTGSNESFIECKVYVGNTLPEAWKQPMHWAAFLVFGAHTRLPRRENGGVGADVCVGDGACGDNGGGGGGINESTQKVISGHVMDWNVHDVRAFVEGLTSMFGEMRTVYAEKMLIEDVDGHVLLDLTLDDLKDLGLSLGHRKKFLEHILLLKHAQA